VTSEGDLGLEACALRIGLPLEVVRTLELLTSAYALVGQDGNVTYSSPRAQTLGLTRRERVAIAEIRDLCDRVFSDGRTREREMRVPRPPLGRGHLDIRAQIALLRQDILLVIVEDLADERRIEAVRRDFVANVSHELKTPVGALSLLAEAVLSASDEPDAVRKFAERMQIEAIRLAHLVNDVIDLSRLQSDEPMSHALILEVDQLVGQAVDEIRVLAFASSIEIEIGGTEGLRVYGDSSQLLMAMRNLLTNAVAYSPANTRVSITVRRPNGVVEIDVKDQGVGIPAHDLDRIFERFYRVDPARSRATGGTGLGLAIVKHVCLNHGGECTVWSEAGVGSTFTLRIPAYDADMSSELGQDESGPIISEEGGTS
jgi:two-component system sensor histidine kinase SenX3